MPDTLEPGGGGRYPERVEDRVSALEGLAQATAATLVRLEARFDNLDRLLADRFGEIDRRFSDVDRRFAEVDRRFAEVDRRFEAVDKRFEALERRIDVLILDHHRDFRWLVGLVLAQTAALLGVMAHGFHWL